MSNYYIYDMAAFISNTASQAVDADSSLSPGHTPLLLMYVMPT